MAEALKRARLVHITTAPAALWAFFVGQIGYMKAWGFEVHAISSPQETLDRFARREQIPVCAVAMSRSVTPLRDLVALARLWRCLRRLCPEIVHAHTPKAGLLGMVAARLAGVPVRIYHIHGLPLTTATGHKRMLLRWSERLACRLAHQVFCVSHSVRDVAIEESLCPAPKIKVLANGSANGVDARVRFNPGRVGAEPRRRLRQQWRIPADALVVGFVGRLVRDKGLAELSQAWRGLREKYPNLHLLLVGDYEPQDPVPTHIRALLEADPCVHLTGWIDNMAEAYTAMDVLALPTYREGLPYVPLEAAAMELAVVATSVPGCVDAVEDGVTGTLVPARDPKGLFEALRAYLDAPALRHAHGRFGRERVLRRFRPEVLWEALRREYLRLIDERALPIPESARDSKGRAA